MTPHTTSSDQRSRSPGRAALTIAVAAVLAAPVAEAGDRIWDDAKLNGAATVAERDRRAFLPDGIRLGTYMMSPDVGASVMFDDNVYATSKNRTSDLRFDATTDLRFSSQFPRHKLNFAFGGRLSEYLENPDLNHQTGYAAVDGALHINHAHTLFARFSTRLDHADNINGNSANPAATFTPIWVNQAAVGLTRDAGRLSGTISASAQHFNFYDITGIDGASIDQDRRDITVFTTEASARYAFSPGYTGILQSRYVRHETSEFASNTGNLDLDGLELMAGLSAEITPVLRARILGGYAFRDYDRQDLTDTSNGLVEASLEWLPTQLMTVKASIRHGFVEPPVQFETSAYDGLTSISTAFSLDIDYEILRNLVLSLDGQYRIAEEVQSGRHSETYIGRVGLDYYHTKNWLFSLAYEHQLRQSNFDDDIARNRAWATARLRF